MDVVFDEVKGNVADRPGAAPSESEAAAAPGPANADRRIHEDLMRMSARRARLLAD